MKLKGFIQNFDINKPSWDTLPEGFPDCDLSGLDSSEVGKFYAIMVVWELTLPQKPKARSRVWQSTRGYRFLVQWTNAVLLRILVRRFTATLPRSEYRTKTQLDDAGRSIVSNIEEGFKRPTTSEYLTFLGYSQGSLEEIHGDTNKCLQDGFIRSIPESNLVDLGIDLKVWSEWAKNPLNSSKILYFPLKKNKGGYPAAEQARYGAGRTLQEIKGEEITYEIFI